MSFGAVDTKNFTPEPTTKSLEDVKSAMLQFRSVLRVSDVGVKEFLDTVVFKGKSNTISYSEFKMRIEAILKNYTADFADYWFQDKDTITREELDKILNDKQVVYDLEDYPEERLEVELKNPKATLKSALEIADIKNFGYVTLEQYQECLASSDINLDRGK